MRTVKFDNYDSFLDFTLIRTDTTIGKPKIKSNTIDVEGSDSVMDFTEYFGEVYYANRTLKLEFETIAPMTDFSNIFSNVQNALDGKRMKIVLSEDPEFYYVGRVSVDEWKSNGRVGKITIECDCEPYKYKKFPTTKEIIVTETATVIFQNLRKRVVPKFTVDAEFQITFGDTTYTVPAGVWSDPRLAFVQGSNTVVFTGTGTVSVEYQERGL